MKLYFDFDGTIADSIRAICEMYNARYWNHPDFVKAIPEDGHKWDMLDICPLAFDGEIKEMFSALDSFNRMRLFDGAYESLKRLSENHEIILVTVGTLQNIRYKADWCDNNLKGVLHQWHFVGGNTLKMDKSFINHHDGIIIDDHQGNLDTANVPYKICASMYTGDWNNQYIGYRAYNFEEIEKAINTIVKSKTYPKRKKGKTS